MYESQTVRVRRTTVFLSRTTVRVWRTLSNIHIIPYCIAYILPNHYDIISYFITMN